MDMIDLAPPGLYEAVITDVGEDTANPELIHGRYLFRLERRSLADISALGNNDPRTSFVLRPPRASPRPIWRFIVPRSRRLVRTMTTEQTAETMRKLHPDPPALQPVLGRESGDAAGQIAGGDDPSKPPAGVPRQPVAGDGADGIGLDHILARVPSPPRGIRWRSRCSSRPMARPGCRR